MAVRRWLIVLVMLALAPGTCIRTEPPPDDFRPILNMQVIAGAGRSVGEAVIEQAWRLTSPNSHFGSYSGLLALPGGTLLAASDTGQYLYFDPLAGDPAPRFGRIAGQAETRKAMLDVEALTRDPATGTIWLAYEGSNAIERRDAQLRNPAHVRPQAMAHFAANSGPEAFTRLADGRFLVIAEGARDGASTEHDGLIFLYDPVQGARAHPFTFIAPTGYSPVDMAQAPDGRVLILLRGIDYGIPPHFRTRILVADPAALTGEHPLWQGRTIANIAPPLPSDNFEGLAVAPTAKGDVTLWLISDDNNMRLQRTLLLQLRWNPNSSTLDTPKGAKD